MTALTAATIEAAEEHAANSRGAGSRRRSWASWTKPRTSAAGRTCPTCTATSAPGHPDHERLSVVVAGYRRLRSRRHAQALVRLEREALRGWRVGERLPSARCPSWSAHTTAKRHPSRTTRRALDVDVAEARTHPRGAGLADLPRGRAVMFSSGSRATLVKTVPWYSGPHAKAIQASIAAHEPGARV